MSVTKEYFGRLGDGTEVSLYTIRTQRLCAAVSDLGAVLVRLETPDREGKMKDIVLGYDDVEHYLENPSCFGAIVGPSANRIAGASFVIDGEEYHLPVNERNNNLHSDKLFYKRFFAAEIGDNCVSFSIGLPDGDAGFPGNRDFTITYSLTDEDLRIDYKVTSDKNTVINMTNHSYFNLSGDPAKYDVLNHLLCLNSTSFTPVDDTYMTTGEIVPTAGTPFDFEKVKPVGQDIFADNEQIRNGNGYDHNWVLDTAGDINNLAALLYSPESGITLFVYTDEPGIQVYSGNFLDGTVKGKKGVVYEQRHGICLETQHYPDSPNKPDWPSVVLRPGETYHSRCIFSFIVKD